MFKIARTAALQLIVFTVLTGVLYPVFVTVISQILFSHAANGSILEVNGKKLGSELIGQPFDDPKYFWSRPSATGSVAYNGLASGGSNLAPTNPALVDAVRARVAKLKAADQGNNAPVPIDLVTASGSGLDPHISPAAAEYQAARVARIRGLSDDHIREAIQRHTQAPTLGILGQPRVNVLQLNLDLDSMPRAEGK
jgi:K+-transporting ATPase ATPase C chain